MANTVKVVMRVKHPAKGWVFVKPQTSAIGRLKPLWTLVDGKPERHPNASCSTLDEGFSAIPLS
ncbi:MAG TPA: hypothetical protein VHF01_12805 [Candidatus Acidoferrum sp.]|nr:hypothetical protein [Candidatus Acidoferrum sp.]